MDESKLFIEGDCLSVQGDPDQWTVKATWELMQSPRLTIETMLKIRFPCCCQQVTLEVVGPAVIWADQTPAWLASLAIGLESNTAAGAWVSKRQ